MINAYKSAIYSCLILFFLRAAAVLIGSELIQRLLAIFNDCIITLLLLTVLFLTTNIIARKSNTRE
jgi:hypothetical protein